MNKPKLNVTAEISVNKSAEDYPYGLFYYIRYSQTSVKEKIKNQSL